MTADGREPVRVRCRGIYATALTALLSGVVDSSAKAEADEFAITQPSEPVRRRFDGSEFADTPPAVRVEDAADRTGVAVTGEPEAVARVTPALSGVAADTLVVRDAAPREAVFEATVDRTVGGGAVLDLGQREAYLPFDRADGYVEAGDRLCVQVHETAAPWSDRRPEAGTAVRVGGSVVELVRGESGASAATPSDDERELLRTTELLSATAPDGWGIEWQYPALDVGVSAMDAALSAASERAEATDAALSGRATAGGGDSDADPERLAVPRETRWVWFGREARFALDEHRRSVTETMAGHHRLKASTERASDAVDFVEAVRGSVGLGATGTTDAIEEDTDDLGFPFAAAAGQFGPHEGETVRIAHGKPDGRLLDLGRATVTERDPEGRVVLERELSSSGEYDALGTPRRPGDVAVTRVREGRWWYPTAYRGADGERKGTYVNVCTPVEVFPEAVRYVDLHVDVVRRPDGEVRRVDDDDLAAAVERGDVSERLAERARSVARTVERAL
ncbi:RNA-binding protein [Halobacteriales archaeon SW_7_71_33]|nr:MAG: RNA-binding protein [Halobacteriales archaeon SW_7_71_33]